ncbi:MAG: Crp/Fnr family transcriptional regulator, partial [Chlorobi bacterium]|nr:Crp/Fnr family transcriptional regulator [Chlorobiota bacterium]
MNVDTQEMEVLCEGRVERDFEKGETIIREGDEILDFIYLKSGLVKLYRKGLNGKDQIISIAKPFDFVSLLSIFSDDHYNYSVTAIEQTTTCNLDLNRIKKISEINAKFTLGLMQRVSRMSDNILINTLEIKQKNLPGRIAHILLFFANNIYKSNEFELPISRREIAELIGMTTENVIRILSEFRKDKTLKIFG